MKDLVIDGDDKIDEVNDPDQDLLIDNFIAKLDNINIEKWLVFYFCIVK